MLEEEKSLSKTSYFHHISAFQKKSSGDDVVVGDVESSSEIFGYVWVFFENFVTRKKSAGI